MRVVLMVGNLFVPLVPEPLEGDKINLGPKSGTRTLICVQKTAGLIRRKNPGLAAWAVSEPHSE